MAERALVRPGGCGRDAGGIDKEKICFTTDDGIDLELYVLEETRIGGTDYILVADTVDDDGNCYILKDLSEEDAAEAVYEMVEDDNELDYLTDIFSQLLDDVDIELE